MESPRARPLSSVETSDVRLLSNVGKQTNRASMPPAFDGMSEAGRNLSNTMEQSSSRNGVFTSYNTAFDAPPSPSPLQRPSLPMNANEEESTTKLSSPAEQQTELSRVPSFSVNDDMAFSSSRTVVKTLPPTPSLSIQPASPIEGPSSDGAIETMNNQTKTLSHPGIEIRIHPEESSATKSPNGDFKMQHSSEYQVPVESQFHQNAVSPPLSTGAPQFENSPQNPDRIRIERTNTATSGDTFQQAQTLFQDFDGTHYQQSSVFPSPIIEAEEPSAAKYNASLPRATAERVPPPEEGMVYYPAPLPATLNLPPRLSMDTPSHAEETKRRELIAAFATEARKSALWFNQKQQEKGVSSDHKKSPSDLSSNATAARLAALPPQLRASVFFEKPSTLQDVSVKDRSAVSTLDALLDASATAPVSAFTDHPFSGRSGVNVYRKGTRKLKQVLSLNNLDKEEHFTTRVSSFLGLRRQSFGSIDALQDETKKANRSGSRAFSLSATIGLDGENADENKSSSSADSEDEDKHQDGAEALDDDNLDNAGPPTTLVAELQLRKAAQKERNRTAVKAFPKGMHATLLELDTVAQIQKRKRKNTRVALAWEDPDVVKNQNNADGDDDDEDIPLGVLYAGKSGGKGMDMVKNGVIRREPIGLIEQRELEDNEPLARRRARLQGQVPISRPISQLFPLASRPMTPSQRSIGSGVNTGDEDDIPGETLAERIKRLKERKELDATIEEVRNNPMSKSFADEMFGEINSERDINGSRPSTADNSKEGEKKVRISPSSKRTPVKSTGSKDSSPRSGTPDSGEETLGQRRARLQAKRLDPNLRPRMHGKSVSQDSSLGGKQHPLRSSTSLADLMQDDTNSSVVGANAAKRATDIFMAGIPQSSLLEAHENMKAARAAQIRGVNAKKATAECILGTYGDIGVTPRKTSSGYKGGLFNNGFGGVSPAMNTNSGQDMGIGMGYQNPSMGMPLGGHPSVPMLGMNMGSTPNLFNMNNNATNMGMGMGTPMNMGMGMNMNPAVMGMNPAMMGMNNLAAGMMNMNVNPYQQQQQNIYQAQRQSEYMAGLHNFGHAPTPGRSTTPQLLTETFLDAQGRERIDAWRFSVQMGSDEHS